MGKNLLVGIGGKARHVKALYVGVGGKARKVKKVYVGVGGKARLVYTSYVAVTNATIAILSTNVSSGNGYGSGKITISVRVNYSPADATNPPYAYALLPLKPNGGYGHVGSSVSLTSSSNGSRTYEVVGWIQTDDESGDRWSLARIQYVNSSGATVKVGDIAVLTRSKDGQFMYGQSAQVT